MPIHTNSHLSVTLNSTVFAVNLFFLNLWKHRASESNHKCCTNNIKQWNVSNMGGSRNRNIFHWLFLAWRATSSNTIDNQILIVAASLYTFIIILINEEINWQINQTHSCTTNMNQVIDYFDKQKHFHTLFWSTAFVSSSGGKTSTSVQTNLMTQINR